MEQNYPSVFFKPPRKAAVGLVCFCVSCAFLWRPDWEDLEDGSAAPGQSVESKESPEQAPGHFRKPHPVAGVADPGKFNHDLRSGFSGLGEPGYTKPKQALVAFGAAGGG